MTDQVRLSDVNDLLDIEVIFRSRISMKSKNVIKKKVCGALGTTFW
jgi:hypothetical protein